jgi:hypothetical protein
MASLVLHVNNNSQESSDVSKSPNTTQLNAAHGGYDGAVESIMNRRR